MQQGVGRCRQTWARTVAPRIRKAGGRPSPPPHPQMNSERTAAAMPTAGLIPASSPRPAVANRSNPVAYRAAIFPPARSAESPPRPARIKMASNSAVRSSGAPSRSNRSRGRLSIGERVIWSAQIDLHACSSICTQECALRRESGPLRGRRRL